MSIWEIILIASVISILLRSIPFVLFNFYKIPDSGKLAEFLGYSANAVIGGIIYSALYGSDFYNNLSGHFNFDQLLKLSVLIVAVIVAIKTKAIFKTLVISILFYTFFLIINIS